MHIVTEKDMFRSSHRRCSITKGVLRNFAKFTAKHLCQSLFFNKVAGLRPFFIEHLWRLILKTIATLFSIEKASRNRVSFFSTLFLTEVKVSINVLGVIRKSALNYCLMARSFFLGKRSKLFFHLLNQWSTMQYI